MVELIQVPFNLDEEKLISELRIKPGSDDELFFTALVGDARVLADPKILYMEADIQVKGKDSVQIEGITFTSSTLRLNLDVAERVFPFIVTCGSELDLLPLPAGDFIKSFWLDRIKADLLHQAIHFFHQHIKRQYLLEKFSSMSPGSGDVTVWPIEQQRELFSLFGNVEALIGVRLTESCLMIPNKTVSGILFPTEVDFRTCQVCHRKDCPSRSAPFDPALWHMIHS